VGGRTVGVKKVVTQRNGTCGGTASAKERVMKTPNCESHDKR